jgi:hypothetical protein
MQTSAEFERKLGGISQNSTFKYCLREILAFVSKEAHIINPINKQYTISKT